MEENITLYFQQGKSDKVYKASLEQQDDNYLVNFAYGRRGATLRTGTKTQTAVDYDKAKKIYDKIVNEKMAKGYIPTEDATNYVTDSEKVATGIHCQLLNPIDDEELTAKLNDDNWLAQEKKDGKRLLLQKKNDEVIAINRKGFSVGAPEVVFNWGKQMPDDFLIDGEAIGERLFVFDILEYKDQDLREQPYTERLEILEKLPFDDVVQLVATAKTQTEKTELLKQLKVDNTEGIVLKKADALVTPGRPNSGGNQLKYKFYETATVLVHKVNDKRSVAISVYDNGATVDVGNVTIAVNKEIPKVGDCIEVRYLYAYKGGSLYQPTFLNVRDDIDQKECAIKQLK